MRMIKNARKSSIYCAYGQQVADGWMDQSR